MLQLRPCSVSLSPLSENGLLAGFVILTKYTPQDVRAFSQKLLGDAVPSSVLRATSAVPEACGDCCNSKDSIVTCPGRIV